LESSKVSIIIPCYNVEEYLKECLDSVLSQSLDDIEVICIDDGSTDSTPAILELYKEKDRRMTVIRQPNSGVSVASNAGLSLAQGEYVYLVDHDDIVASGALKTCYTLARKFNADTVHFNSESLYENDELRMQYPQFESPKRIGYEKLNPLTGPELFRMLFLKGDYRPPLWRCFFSNSFLKKHSFRFIPGISSQDNVFSFQTILSAETVVFCEKVLYHHRIRPGAVMTTQRGRDDTISRIIVLEQMQSFLEKKAPDLPNDVLSAAKGYLFDQRQYVFNFHLKNLTEADTEYMDRFNALNDYKEYAISVPITFDPPSGSDRLKNKIKKIFGK